MRLWRRSRSDKWVPPPMVAADVAYKNTDRELWREPPGDYYADSIHVTERGGIGINCGGTVYVKTLREWHRLAARLEEAEQARSRVEKQGARYEGNWQQAEARVAALEAALRRIRDTRIATQATSIGEPPEPLPENWREIQGATAVSIARAALGEDKA